MKRTLFLFILSGCFVEPEEAVQDAAPRLDAVTAGHLGLLINEVSATGDYVELFNSGDVISVEGWALVDGGFVAGDASTHVAHRLLLTGDIDFGARHLVPELPFGLGVADVVRLLDAEGNEIDRVSWAAGAADPAHCRVPDGAGPFLRCAESPNSANGAFPAPSTAGHRVVINELASSGEDPIELLNLGEEPLDLTGFSLADESTLANARSPLSGMLTDRLVVEKGLDRFGLGTGDSLFLLDPQGGLVDSTTYPDGAAFASWCRIPDGTGDFQICGRPTFGEVNEP